MVVLYHQTKRIEMGFCMRKEVPSIKKCRLRSKKRHFHLDGSIKREKFRFQCISSLNILYVRIHYTYAIEINGPDFNDDSNYAQSCPNALASSEYNIYIYIYSCSYTFSNRNNGNKQTKKLV